MQNLIEKWMPWGPVFFGVLVFGPMWATVLDFDLGRTMVIGGIWGYLAKRTGNWLLIPSLNKSVDLNPQEQEREEVDRADMEAEREIARKYIGGFPFFMVAWGLGGFALWVSLFPLVHLGYLPLWLGTVLATIVLCYCYLPTHEAQHGNIGRPNTRWRWLNELVGHLSAFPMFLPYRLHRAIHLRHHAHANVRGKDPDLYMRAETLPGAIAAAWRSHQPDLSGGNATQVEVLGDNPNKEKLALEGFLVQRLCWVLMALLCWTGFALEALMLWWFPLWLAYIYTPVTLSWAPHTPMNESGRYRDTRVWKSGFGTILSAGMEYHVVHHLFPAIPLNLTPAAYRELKPLMRERGMRFDQDL